MLILSKRVKVIDLRIQKQGQSLNLCHKFLNKGFSFDLHMHVNSPSVSPFVLPLNTARDSVGNN